MSELIELAQNIKAWGQQLGFAEVRITDVDLSHTEAGFEAWIQARYHGEMGYMQAHGLKRARPAELLPGTLRVITVRMNYLPEASLSGWRKPDISADQAKISVYAHGRDYHKVLRSRLQSLAQKIEQQIGPFGYRVFTDSAPVMEVALAEKSGLGWRGKHTLLLNREAGSMFFLGEILIDIALPVDPPLTSHCGQCSACMQICPTQAIVAPYTLDARLCISYLTIELQGSIPPELRSMIGNRVYGCDDCQIACPWNKFAQHSGVDDFEVRNGLDDVSMVALFSWTEEQFMRRMEGSAIRRIGHQRWLRNLAVGLGNAALSMRADAAIVAALQSRLADASEMLREHILWALQQHGIEVV